jgi:hypothetical protein
MERVTQVIVTRFVFDHVALGEILNVDDSVGHGRWEYAETLKAGRLCKNQVTEFYHEKHESHEIRSLSEFVWTLGNVEREDQYWFLDSLPFRVFSGGDTFDEFA